MNAQLASPPTLNFQLEEEALPARAWATMLGITPKALHLRKVVSCGQCLNRGGLTKLFAFSALPNDYQEALETKRRELRCLRFADLLDSVNNARSGQQQAPAKAITEHTEFEQEKAYQVKDVLTVYFSALEQGMAEIDANTKARAMWLQIFGEPCNERTIRRRAKRVEEMGGPEFARIEAYADRKSGVAHEKARLLHRLDFPLDFISAFKTACLRTGMISAAYRDFDIEWKAGRPIPGFGAPKKVGSEFPLTLEQIRNAKIAPTRAAMIQHSRGKFAAKTSGAVPLMWTASSQLRRCERYIFDDTRIDIAALDDVTGDPITLKSYWCMEEASRQIVGFTIMKGRNASQADVDALTARVLRTSGIAAPGAGYKTRLKYEKGATACSPARKRFLEAMFPGQIEISDTDMIGGRNAAGDFTQDNSGNFFGKGKIESFMRTLAYFCRHIEGQRGGHYRLQPAALGIAGEDRTKGSLVITHTKGTMADESTILAKAARALTVIESRGTDLSPEARLAAKAFDIQTPLHFESDVREAIALAIAYYNQFWTEHRMEGFLDVPVAKENGGRKWRKESPSEKARRLELDLEAIGKSPVRISPADACALLYKAQHVTVKPDGVVIRIDGVAHRFWRADSIACYEAQRLATLEKDYIALFDREWPQEIYLLRNTPSHFPGRKKSFELALNTAQFLECLPLSEAPQVNDPVAMSRHRAEVQHQQNRTAREVARDIEPQLRDVTATRESNLSKIIRITTTVGGDQRKALPATGLGAAISQGKSRKPRTRAEEMPSAEANFAAYLAQESGEAS
jgi:hypothetical protein